jgi:hypothetical protein
MTIPADSLVSYSTIGVREDLKDFIANISPKDTPFVNRAGKTKASNTFFEWLTDSLVDAAANAQLEGDDYAATAIAQPTRLGNRCQISSKAFTISGTADVVNKAGRNTEMAYQLAKKTMELKRDMEFIVTRNQASVTGNSTTARATGSLEAQITANTSINGDTGGGYTNANWVAISDGTQRPFTESLLKDVCQKVFTSGGDPDVLMVGPAQKQVVSGFTGNATRMDKSEDQKLYTAIDVYVSDFGEFKVVPNRFQRNRTAFLLQMDMWQIAYLRPIEVHDLAKTGDAMKKLLTVEYGLLGKNQAASGVIRSLT